MNRGFCATAPYPRVEDFKVNPSAVAEVETLKQLITAIRLLRSDFPSLLNKDLSCLTLDPTFVELMSPHNTTLNFLVKATLSYGERPSCYSLLEVCGVEVWVPLGEHVDIEGEKRRLSVALSRCEADLRQLESKLDNKSFIDNAPEDVVSDVRARYNTANQRKVILQRNLDCLGQRG